MTDVFFEKSESAGTTITVRFSDGKGEAVGGLPRFAVGYWGIKGLGAPIRMMLCAAKADFNAYCFDVLEDGEAGGGKWKFPYFSEKPKFMEKYNPFMNLPFVVDRKERIFVCQSNACFLYLGRELGMWGDTPSQVCRCEELLCELYDIRNVMIKFCYGGDPSKEAATEAVNKAMGHYKKIEHYLEMESKNADSKPCHLVGGKFTAPDFHLFEMIDQYSTLCQIYSFDDILGKLPHLKAFQTGFAGLSENQFYLNSPMHKDLPFNNVMAIFGSAPDGAAYKHGQDAPWKGQGEVTYTAP